MAGKVKGIRKENILMSFWHNSFFFYVLFVGCFLLIFAGCNDQQKFDDSFYDMPSEQKKVELLDSLDKKFENPEAHFLLGQLYHAERAWDDAEYHYNIALRFDPIYRPAQAGMIKLLLDKGDTVKADIYLENYMNQVAGSPNKLLELAKEFQTQQLDSYALICYQEALNIAPNSAQVNKAIGYFYLSRNNKEKAREHFEKSFKIDGTQTDVSRELGKLLVPIKMEQE